MNPQAPAAGVSRIGQVAIRAPDVAAAVTFYCEVLGCRHLFTVNDRLAFVDCGGVRLMLGPAEKPEFDHPASIMYYMVPDLDAAHARLGERQVPCESEPHLIARMSDHELWMAFYRDPAGNLFALMQEKR